MSTSITLTKDDTTNLGYYAKDKPASQEFSGYIGTKLNANVYTTKTIDLTPNTKTISEVEQTNMRPEEKLPSYLNADWGTRWTT